MASRGKSSREKERGKSSKSSSRSSSSKDRGGSRSKKAAPAGGEEAWLAEQIAELGGGADEEWLQQQMTALGADEGKKKKKKKSSREKEPGRESRGAWKEKERSSSSKGGKKGSRGEAEARARAKAAAAEAEAARRAAPVREEVYAPDADEDEEDDYGDDDFDDCDDDDGADFEDDDGDVSARVGEVAAAMAAENLTPTKPQPPPGLGSPSLPKRSFAPAGSTEPEEATSPLRTSSSTPERAALPTRASVDYSTPAPARIDRTALRKAGLRWKQLVTTRRVQLTASYSDLFEQQPMSMAQVQVRYGRSGVRGVHIQTGDDNGTVEVQTEEPLTAGVGAQVPDDLGLVPERAVGQRPGASKAERDADARVTPARKALTVQVDRQRLGKFMARALPVLEAILSATDPGPVLQSLQAEDHGDGSSTAISGTYTKVDCPSEPLGGSKAAVDCCALRSTLVVAYLAGPVPLRNDSAAEQAMAAAADTAFEQLALDGSGAGVSGLVVWNLTDVREPDSALLCAGTPSCCWVGEGRVGGDATSTLVASGTVEGSLVVWDLGRPADDPQGRRWPAYCTDGVLGVNHEQPVICVRAVSATTRERSDEKENSEPSAAVAAGSGLGARAKNLQLCTMDAQGSLVFWALIPLDASDADDVGIGFGSRIKVMQLSKVSPGVDRGVPAAAGGFDAVYPALNPPCFDLATSPLSSNASVCCGACGKTRRVSRFGRPPAPHTYTKPQSTADVLSVHFSPLLPLVFAAGSMDGSVALFSCRVSTPALILSAGGSAIRCVRWSPTRPAVLFALDAHSTLYAFDLTRDRIAPISTVRLGGERSGSSCVCMEVAAGGSFGGLQTHRLFAGFEDGHVDVHYVTAVLAMAGKGELGQASALLGI